MKAIRLFQLIVILSYVSQAFAQQSPEDFCKIFFDKYKNQNSDSAINFLFRTNKFTSNFKEQTDELKHQLGLVVAQSGML